MDFDFLAETVAKEFKVKMDSFCKNLNSNELTPELAMSLRTGLLHSMSGALSEGYKRFVESYDEEDVTAFEVDGKVLCRKKKSKKK